MIALRPTRPTAQATRAFSGLALGLTLAVTVLAAPGSARAADDETPLDTKIMRGILEGIGLQRENRVINYQERPPLVIPPSKSLPPPERSDAVIANNPAWPKDPDVERAKAEAARERTTVIWAGDEAQKQDSVLRGKDLGPGPSAKRSASRAGKSESNWSSDDPRLKPSELGYKGGLFSSLFGGTRDRQIHRRAATCHTDRAAAGLPDAVAGPALRSQRERKRAEGDRLRDDARRRHQVAAGTLARRAGGSCACR